MNLYSVKMRASRAGEHVSGAEKIVEASAAAATAARLVERALNHEKGTPDFVNVKLSAPGEIIRLKALAVTNNVVASAAEGRELAIELLERDGIARAREIMELLPQTHSMRGAMLIDADTLERLDGDGERGVRATCMDDAESSVPACRTIQLYRPPSSRFVSQTTVLLLSTNESSSPPSRTTSRR